MTRGLHCCGPTGRAAVVGVLALVLAGLPAAAGAQQSAEPPHLQVLATPAPYAQTHQVSVRGTQIAYEISIGVMTVDAAPVTGDVVARVSPRVSAPREVAGGGVWSPADRTITWPAVHVDPGVAFQSRYAVSVLDTATAGDVVNEVTFLGVAARTVHVVGPARATVRVVADWQVPYGTAKPASIGTGERLIYSIGVTNDSDAPLSGPVVVDPLPGPPFALMPGSVGDGVLDAARGTVTWQIALAPGESWSTTLHGLIAPFTQRTELVLTAAFQGVERTVVVVAHPGALAVEKSVTSSDPQVNPGDTLTYTITVRAAGPVDEQDVVVRDYLPGYAPDEVVRTSLKVLRGRSGETIYVPGSARCLGSGPCTASYDPAQHLVTWRVGDLAPGAQRSVSFSVVVDPLGNAGKPLLLTDLINSTDAAPVFNVGRASSAGTPEARSRDVYTPVTLAPAPPPTTPAARPAPTAAPQQQPATLPYTGWSVPTTAAAAGGLLVVGVLLVGIGRRRAAQRRP